VNRGARKERREEAAKREHVLLLACFVSARVARLDLHTKFENFRVAIETRNKLPSPDKLKIKIIEEVGVTK